MITTDEKKYSEKFENVLPIGKENAINRFDLLEKTGYSNLRSMRQDIHRARREGCKLLSRSDSTGGYYMAADRSELIEFRDSMKRRGVSTLGAIKEVNRMLKDTPYQINIMDLLKEAEESEEENV